jgi:hypothetical protein
VILSSSGAIGSFLGIASGRSLDARWLVVNPTS